MIKFFKYLWLYLRNRKEINDATWFIKKHYIPLDAIILIKNMSWYARVDYFVNYVDKADAFYISVDTFDGGE